MTFRQAVTCTSVAVLTIASVRALAQSKSPTPPAAAASCKMFGGGPCCDPSVSVHLKKEAVLSSCSESEATFLGEQGSKNTCKYFFKIAGQKDEEMFVQVYSPPANDVPASPNDPFFSWKRVGAAFVTDRALSPKAAPMMARSTGLWLPGKGYFVAVNASTGVCSKAEARRLAAKLR